MHIYGIPKKIIMDDIKHIQLFVACNPKDGVLIMLYIIVNSNISLNIPSNIDITKITIILEITRYIPTSPYSISFNLISS